MLKLCQLMAVLALVWACALPEGLDTQVGSGGQSLTHPQSQQLALARLVLANPHTLVLDEATSLLDHCPAEFRRYAGLRKNPLALAWLAQRHLEGEIGGLRQAYRDVRVEVGPHVTPEALAEILIALEAEGLRLVADRRSAELLHEALAGKVFVPRL